LNARLCRNGFKPNGLNVLAHDFGIIRATFKANTKCILSLPKNQTKTALWIKRFGKNINFKRFPGCSHDFTFVLVFHRQHEISHLVRGSKNWWLPQSPQKEIKLINNTKDTFQYDAFLSIRGYADKLYKFNCILRLKYIPFVIIYLIHFTKYFRIEKYQLLSLKTAVLLEELISIIKIIILISVLMNKTVNRPHQVCLQHKHSALKILRF